MNITKAIATMSFAVLLWFCAVKHFHMVEREQEIDISWKGARLQLMANGVHCDGS